MLDNLAGRGARYLDHAAIERWVAPRLVEGTLRAGFDIAAPIVHPFARALYVMFLLAEVRPFADGDERLARIMMNAELVATSQVPINIPTVFRDEYIGSLKNDFGWTNAFVEPAVSEANSIRLRLSSTLDRLG